MRNLVTAISSLLIALCPAVPVAAQSPDPLATRLDAALSAAAGHDRFYGTVLLARDGKVLLRKAYGPRDRQGTPATPRQHYNIGSVGKLFTMALILKQVQNGRLTLDDTIAMHWPESGLPNADKITIRQLLSHTSGYGNYFDNPDYSLAQRSTDDFLNLVRSGKVEFAPGTGFFYSNSAFWVLARILEKTDPQHRDWQTLFREEIFQPAGMNTIVALQPDEASPERPDGFVLRPDGTIDPSLQDPRPGPDGGWYATADDLLAFSRGIERHLWFGSVLDQLATRPVAHWEDLGADVGLVWELYAAGDRHYVTKGGTTQGGGAELIRFRHGRANYTLVLLSNLENAPLFLFKPLLAYANGDPEARLPGADPQVTLYRAALDHQLPSTVSEYRKWARANELEIGPMPMLMAGMGLSQKGKSEEAKNLLQLTSDLFPDNTLARDLLASVTTG
ncbi:serine hydrolase domain-containing protein [Flavisphingopyxis soli]|nr:serine hydrolase domain-containing protein [Sphingorhabdus soli]